EGSRDLSAGLALGHEPRNLALALCQLFPWYWLRPTRASNAMPGVKDNRRHDVPLMLGEGLNCCQDRNAILAFCHIAVRTRRQCLSYGLLVVKHRKDENLHLRQQVADLAESFQPRAKPGYSCRRSRHTQVEHHEIRLQLDRQVHCLLAVARLPAHFPIWVFGLNETAQPLSNNWMVVSQKYASHPHFLPLVSHRSCAI